MRCSLKVLFFQLPPIVKNNRITRSAVNSSNSKSGELIAKRSYCEVASSEASCSKVLKTADKQKIICDEKQSLSQIVNIDSSTAMPKYNVTPRNSNRLQQKVGKVNDPNKKNLPELKIMNTSSTCILQNKKVYNNSEALVNIKSDKIKNQSYSEIVKSHPSFTENSKDLRYTTFQRQEINVDNVEANNQQPNIINSSQAQLLPTVQGKESHLKELKDAFSCKKSKTQTKQQRYYEKNKQKIREKQREYNRSHKLQIKEKQSQYNKEHQSELKEKQKQYNKNHKAQIAEKQKLYKKEHKVQINEKQKQYNKEHQTQIAEKQRQYDKEHQAQIAEKQKQYNKEHQAQIAEKQKQYNKEHEAQITEKPKQYNKEHQAQITEKQNQYNKEHQAQIAEKQRQYDKEHQVQITEKQRHYNKEHQAQITEKQRQYNKEHQAQITEKQRQYNKEHQAQITEKQRHYNKEHQAQITEQQRQYNEEHQTQIIEKQRQYNILHQTEIMEKQRCYNKEHQASIQQKQVLYNREHRSQINEKQSNYNELHQEAIQRKQITYNMIRSIKCSNKSEHDRILAFQNSLKDSCSYVCASCQMNFFKNSVVYKSYDMLKDICKKNFTYDVYRECFIDITIPDSCKKTDKLCLCRTCLNSFIKGKKPKLNVSNGLQVDVVPENLKNLSEVEQVLISKDILFIKIWQLPKSRWSAVSDKIVNVPIADNDIITNVSSLPRTPKSAGIIGVDFKRKKEMKSSVLKQYIDVHKLGPALITLKSLGHPSYQFIDINADFLNKELDIDDTSLNQSSELGKDPDIPIMTDSDNDDENDAHSDHSEDENDCIQRHQIKGSNSTCLTHCFPETNIVTNNSSNNISKKQYKNCENSFIIAPGESKIPTNIMKNNNWDINAFPSLFPSGRFGLHYERKDKVSLQQYAKQRLLNCDNRFASCTPYVFALLYLIEKSQLEQNISISYSKGQKSFSDTNVVQISNHDAFSVFKKIKGTDAYWKEAKYEMIASVEQLGPFHIFFFLSCADKRWAENFTSLFELRGHKVECIPSANSDYLTISEEDIFVDGMPLEDFLQGSNLHDLVRQNILTITRNFDHRVKMFRTHILMGKNNPLCVKYYKWRVEFQLRGAAHIHGVLWLDMDSIDQLKGSSGELLYPNLSAAMRNLHENNLSLVDHCSLIKFIDNNVSCSRSNSSVSNIVEQVNWHSHSKTCRKHHSVCRFHFPKFPSDRTIIAQCLPDTLDEKDNHQILNKSKSILQAVKCVLVTFPEKREELDEYIHKNSISIEKILKLANVSEAEYYQALSISLSGTSIILKRQPSEIYINNYNHEWILAWNGNLDIQICLDFFAVVTYITDYYSKSETKLTDVLVRTAKENKDKTLQQRMRLLAQTFLTHRKMGESEAYYRIFPFLHLKESNIKCTFVQSGFESKRHKFLIPAYTTKNENDCNEPSGEECDTVAFSHKFLVEGHEAKGAFIEKPSVHDHYKRRPLYLEKMCLAQFAIMYDQCVKNSIKEDLLCGISSSFGSLTCHLLITSDPPTNNVYLPKFISCNSIYFKLRNYPLILRIHKYDQMKNPHEYAYSELCLFRPWRDENELEENDLVSCLQLWNTCCPTECDEELFRDSCVDKVKKKLFPNWSIVHQSRNIVYASESQRLQHIGDCLDSQLQQDEEDDFSEGIMPHSEHQIIDPDFHSLSNSEKQDTESFSFKITDFTAQKLKMIVTKAQKLVPEQRFAFDIAVKHAKAIKRSFCSSSNKFP